MTSTTTPAALLGHAHVFTGMEPLEPFVAWGAGGADDPTRQEYLEPSARGSRSSAPRTPQRHDEGLTP